MPETLEKLAGELQTRPRWIVLGVGNRWRQDDGVGCFIARELETRFPGRAFNAENRPEDLHEEILTLRPHLVLLLDAALFNESPGSLKLLPLEGILRENLLFSHKIPLSWLAELWRTETESRILFLGIQPALVGYGEELSPPVTNAAKDIFHLLEAFLKT